MPSGGIAKPRIGTNDLLTVFALAVLQAAVSSFYYMGAKKMQGPMVRGSAGSGAASPLSRPATRDFAIVVPPCLARALQDVVVLGGLAIVVATLLYDGMAKSAATALKPIAARLRGATAKASSEAVWRSAFFTCLWYLLSFGALAGYVMPNMEAVLGTAPSYRIGYAVFSAAVPALVASAHGRKLI